MDRRKASVIVVLAIGFCCIVSLIIYNFSPLPDDEPNNTQVPKQVNTQIPDPTNTSISETPTIIIPEPTITQIQVAPTCEEILANKDRLTDVQWKNFKKSIEGMFVDNWRGQVENVGGRSILAGGFPISIYITRKCDLYIVVEDEQTALQYSKDQFVDISGAINFISELFGNITLHIEENNYEIVISEEQLESKVEIEPIEIINLSEYISSDGDLILYGEVKNVSESPLKDIEITGKFYDADGNLLAIESSYADMPLTLNLWHEGILYPGEQAPLSIYVDEPGDWISKEITIDYSIADYSDQDKLYRDLKIINDVGREIDDILYDYRVTGEIENVGDFETGSVRIITTLYDEDGNVVGMDTITMTDKDPFYPGEIVPFSVDVFSRGTVASYSLLIRSIKH